MNSITKSLVISLLGVSVLASTFHTDATAEEKLTKNEYTVLKVCEGIIQLFKQTKDAVWPGYDLAKKPFIVYMPGKWALLLNYTQPVDGFSEYPRDWPHLEFPVLYHQGQYGDLIGQLAFDFNVDTLKTVAIGVSEEMLDSLAHPELRLFGHCVHEVFHQFQSESFGEIPWEREERYPILDSQNTSLAYIEMKLLMDALTMMQSGNNERFRDNVEQFVAVRNYRWQHGDPFIARYEQGQELREGTARYVEMKSIELMKALEYKSSLDGLTSSLRQDFAALSFHDLLVMDLRDRMTGYSIQPEDMPRNRIYPIGSAIGFLLDYLRVDWKSKAQQAGQEVTFAGLLTDSLAYQKNRPDELVNRAKNAYRYEAILTSTNTMIGEYLEGFRKELAAFESHNGYRIQIDFTARSLTRSRSSRAKKWLVDNGTQSLCSNYGVYTLKNNDVLLQVKNSAVRESIDWDSKKYSIIFFASVLPGISMDGADTTLADEHLYTFQHAELSGANFTCTYSKSGTITLLGRKITVRLNQ